MMGPCSFVLSQYIWHFFKYLVIGIGNIPETVMFKRGEVVLLPHLVLYQNTAI